MGEFTDKLNAAGNKVAGNVKEAAGKATSNDKLAAEGKAQQVKGTATKGGAKVNVALDYKGNVTVH